MRELIRGQDIRIDDHRSGTNQPKNWDDTSAEVHLDKRTNWGKRERATIKIPINSDREPYYELSNQRDVSFRRRISKEINDALSDRKKRERFVKEIIERIKNFESDLTDREKAQSAVKRIARAFDLNEKIVREMTLFSDHQLLSFFSLHTDIDDRIYFIRLTRFQIRIGELNARLLIRLIHTLF